MSLPGKRLRRRRRVRRAASTSSSARPGRGAGRRRLQALATGVDVALCRLHYYLERVAGYQADLQAHQPLQHLTVSSLDASFRTDVKSYLLAVQADIRRLESGQKAVGAAPGVAGAGAVGRAAQSAPALLGAERRPPARSSSSSSDSDGADGGNSSVSQRGHRRSARRTASATQLRGAASATESSGEREDSSSDSGAAGTVGGRRSGSSGWAVGVAVAAAGCGPPASGETSCGAPASGESGAASFRAPASSQSGEAAAAGGWGCPPGSAGVTSKDGHGSGGTATGAEGEVRPSHGAGTATGNGTKVRLSANELPVSTGGENGGQPLKSSSVCELNVQRTGDVCDRQMCGSAGVGGKSSVGTNSSNSSSRPTVNSAKSGAQGMSGNLTGKSNQDKRGSAVRRASPHPLAPPLIAARADASSTARQVLRELFRMYGLLCRLLDKHSKRLLQRTCAAALQLPKGQQLSIQQLSLQQPLSRAQLERASAAAAAELLRTRTMLCDCAVRARAFCEVARRLRALRPRKPPRRRKCATGTSAAKPPPAPPPPQLRPESAFSLERLLSLFLCWTRPCSD